MNALLSALRRTLSLPLTVTIALAITATSLAAPLAANTQSDQRKVRKAIQQLNQQIDKKKQESNSIGSQVTKLEKELGVLSRKQHDTEKKIKTAQTRLVDASAQKSKLHKAMKLHQSALAQQLQAMHTAGEQSHLRLLLMQDNPSDISRNLQYFEYLNRYRSGKITAIDQTGKELEAVTAAAKKERVELKKLGQKLEQQEEQVKIKLASRATTLEAVKSDINSQRKRLNKLVSQEKALQKEIDRIARRAAKRAAERAAKAAAKQRARAAAAEKRKQQQRANSNQRKQQQARNKQQQKQRNTGRQVATSRTPNRPFSKLRGKLSWPVSGRVIHRYNSRRNEKQRWRGVVIAAPGGAKVRTVAAGRVVFAGWMNGYGHLIMVEHDRNYMSLYGYNRAVFKRVGQQVRANEVIASVGNSSGQSRNALYFEIRRRTTPQNPTRWLR